MLLPLLAVQKKWVCWRLWYNMRWQLFNFFCVWLIFIKMFNFLELIVGFHFRIAKMIELIKSIDNVSTTTTFALTQNQRWSWFFRWNRKSVAPFYMHPVTCYRFPNIQLKAVNIRMKWILQRFVDSAKTVTSFACMWIRIWFEWSDLMNFQTMSDSYNYCLA